MKTDPFNIIVRPLVTEKGQHQAQKLNAYTFAVHPEANKVQIRHAVEVLYDVKVTEVRTANIRGKRRRGKNNRQGTTSHWKKAVVVLHTDYHIDTY